MLTALEENHFAKTATIWQQTEKGQPNKVSFVKRKFDFWVNILAFIGRTTLGLMKASCLSSGSGRGGRQRGNQACSFRQSMVLHNFNCITAVRGAIRTLTLLSQIFWMWPHLIPSFPKLVKSCLLYFPSLCAQSLFPLKSEK